MPLVSFQKAENDNNSMDHISQRQAEQKWIFENSKQEHTAHLLYSFERTRKSSSEHFLSSVAEIPSIRIYCGDLV